MDNLKRIYEQIEQAPAYSKEVEDFKLWVLTIIKREMEVRDDTPFPEHHGDLIDRNELLKQYGLENATKYGNKNAEQQKHSYSTMMMYEIADMIEDAETIIPATKEGDGE